MRASAREDVGGDADRGDQRSAADCPEEERFGRIGGNGDRERRAPRPGTRRRLLRRRLHDDGACPLDGRLGRTPVDGEERVRIERRQLRERTLAQLGADEHELRGEGLGNRDAHSTRFGIRVHRP